MEQTNKALLVMDMQLPIVGMLPDSTSILANVTKAIESARQQHIPVIYVVVGFRQGMPEISANNKGFSEVKQRMANADMNEWIKIHPDVAPQESDIIVTKRRISAFAGSDLEIVLRGQNVQHLVLTGISTSGVVLSTLREAADKDYQLTVIADCCADGDEEVHRVLTTKIFPRQANVINVQDWSNLH
ncbi:isochorismatase [Arachidicoccus ginsenosidimutans]|uniref:cysteine hydrolase family protein n=1 Tax=Arachidicoccus sp. BS20 TaxID=1850526 RepID=UPI0007F096B7|nr:isochorismatase family cysteine hydrolase [Arachidicoccus sp. BS20]ANI90598.1 isochorismatase [Arachidicoccus sp. BS20]